MINIAKSISFVLLLCLLSLAGICPEAVALTNVSGYVSGVWNAEEDPYVVLGTVTILDGGTLEIEPGVEVQFVTDQSMIVNGTLLATGALEDSIRFVGYNEDRWGGIDIINASENCWLQYCVITDGLSSGDTMQSACGGGIYIENSSPTIEFCRIENCEVNSETIDDTGGAIACFGGSPIIENNLIINCTQNSIFGGGGGIYCDDASATIRYNEIRNCQAFSYGGGIYGVNSAVNISHNIISGCSCLHGGAGIDLQYNCTGELFNNLITGNHSEDLNGGVMIFASYVDVFSCSIIGNTSNGIDANAAMSAFASEVEVTNCVFWNNDNLVTPSKPPVGPPNLPDVSYCDIEGGYTGTGNIDQDPLFVSYGSNNYFLSQMGAGQAADSPCLDAGLGSASSLDLDDYTTRTDMIGDAGAVDMGFHYDPNISTSVDDQGPLSVERRLIISPNPFIGRTTIQLTAPTDAADRLYIHDASGRLVRTLYPDTGSSQRSFTWHGLDENRVPASRGVYFIRRNHGAFIPGLSEKIILCR